MFSLTIVFGPGPMVWTLMFKEKEDADTIMAVLRSIRKIESRDPYIELIDDYGQQAVIETAAIQGYMLEDLNLSKGAHIERALHQARTKIAGDKLAESDPVIKEASRRQQGGMPTIQPMGAMPGFANGGFRG